MKKIIFLILVVGLVFVSLFPPTQGYIQHPYNFVAVKVGLPQWLPTQSMVLETEGGQVEVRVAVADDPAEREIGLMHRSSLKEGKGMWFIFDDSATRRFWMKNMKISIDIIYLSADKEVRSFIENVPPCEKSASACDTYPSTEPSQYVLEVPAGFIKKYGVTVGDVVYEVSTGRV